MELWVRSQDRETLIKTENISIDNENYIIGNLICDDNKSICDYWRLGHYETKERALEVLDEIQNKIEDNEKSYLMACMKEKGTYEVIAWEDFVYEMPKK